jgi:hypothetical protein
LDLHIDPDVVAILGFHVQEIVDGERRAVARRARAREHVELLGGAVERVEAHHIRDREVEADAVGQRDLPREVVHGDSHHSAGDVSHPGHDDSHK